MTYLARWLFTFPARGFGRWANLNVNINWIKGMGWDVNSNIKTQNHWDTHSKMKKSFLLRILTNLITWTTLTTRATLATWTTLTSWATWTTWSPLNTWTTWTTLTTHATLTTWTTLTTWPPGPHWQPDNLDQLDHLGSTPFWPTDTRPTIPPVHVGHLSVSIRQNRLMTYTAHISTGQTAIWPTVN